MIRTVTYFRFGDHWKKYSIMRFEMCIDGCPIIM